MVTSRSIISWHKSRYFSDIPHIYIYIYIYIYIVIHRLTVSFYHNSSVSLDMQKHLKLRSKPGWHYASRIFYHTATSKFYHIFIAFVLLTYIRLIAPNSLEELFITQVATGNSFTRIHTHTHTHARTHTHSHTHTHTHIYIYIVYHKSEYTPLISADI